MLWFGYNYLDAILQDVVFFLYAHLPVTRPNLAILNKTLLSRS